MNNIDSPKYSIGDIIKYRYNENYAIGKISSIVDRRDKLYDASLKIIIKVEKSNILHWIDLEIDFAIRYMSKLNCPEYLIK